MVITEVTDLVVVAQTTSRRNIDLCECTRPRLWRSKRTNCHGSGTIRAQLLAAEIPETKNIRNY